MGLERSRYRVNLRHYWGMLHYSSLSSAAKHPEQLDATEFVPWGRQGHPSKGSTVSVEKDVDHPSVIRGLDEYVASSFPWIFHWLIDFIQCLLVDPNWLIFSLPVYHFQSKIFPKFLVDFKLKFDSFQTFQQAGSQVASRWLVRATAALRQCRGHGETYGCIDQ